MLSQDCVRLKRGALPPERRSGNALDSLAQQNADRMAGVYVHIGRSNSATSPSRPFSDLDIFSWTDRVSPFMILNVRCIHVAACRLSPRRSLLSSMGECIGGWEGKPASA